MVEPLCTCHIDWRRCEYHKDGVAKSNYSFELTGQQMMGIYHRGHRSAGVWADEPLEDVLYHLASIVDCGYLDERDWVDHNRPYWFGFVCRLGSIISHKARNQARLEAIWKEGT